MKNPSFMEERHASFGVSKAFLSSIVEKAAGEKLAKSERIVAGYANEVYSATTVSGKELIIRIHRFGDLSFAEEAWAMEECRKAGVAVPHILLLDQAFDNDLEMEVMIITRLPGTPLESLLATLIPEKVDAILKESGTLLGQIHAIKVGGFYQRHEDGRWDFSTWKTVMDSTVYDRSAEKPLILQAGFSEQEFEFMVQCLVHYRDEFSYDQPALCHGDYLPEHIFVDDNLHVTGVIDFGLWQGGPPIHNFAFFALERKSLSIEPLKAGYGDKSLFTETFETELQLYKLMLGMGHLAHHIKIEDAKGAKFLAGQVRSTLETLKKYELV